MGQMMRKQKAHSNRRAKPQTFKSVRKQVLIHWLKQSKRKRTKDGDDIRNNALDCAWHELSPEGVHCNFFCGVGEWVSGVTDVLTDKSCDELSFANQAHKPRLYRQYLRLMFVVNEVLEDLEHGLDVCGKNGDQTGRRSFLYPNADKFICFVNHVLKHKAKTFHSKNNHLPILFEDAGEQADENSMKILNRPEQPISILIPKLKVLIDIVLIAYKNFDDFIREDDVSQGEETKVTKLNKKFGVDYLTEAVND